MVQKLKLTRDQLREFLRDHESIKQFESLFQQTNLSSETIDVINSRLLELENPPGISISVDHQASTDAYWIEATVTGLTVTLPKCDPEILGRTWAITLSAVGDVAIVTTLGDTFKTPDSATETTAILNRRGSTVVLRCSSVNNWVFA